MMVGVVMGSKSDIPIMEAAYETLTMLRIPHEVLIISAHRNPDKMFKYAEGAKGRLDAIIAGAGGAAHLPGMLASKTSVPVLGVPIQSEALRGIDSLLSIVQMPAGVPVATFAIGKPGAINAAIFVARMLGQRDATIAESLEQYRLAREE